MLSALLRSDIQIGSIYYDEKALKFSLSMQKCIDWRGFQSAFIRAIAQA